MSHSQEQPGSAAGSFKRISVREACEAIAIPSYQPVEREAVELIERAKSHPLGTAYLRDGALDAVAATFSVHAFVVDHARTILPGSSGGNGSFVKSDVAVPMINYGKKPHHS